MREHRGDAGRTYADAHAGRRPGALVGAPAASAVAPRAHPRRAWDARRGPVRRAALAATALLLLGASPGIRPSEDPARSALPPPSPRAPRVPEGALFFDDFSAGFSRWSPDRDSVWTVTRGMARAELPDARQQRSLAYAGSEAWEDYAVDFDVCQMRGVDKGAVVRVKNGAGVGVDLRGPGYQDVLLYRNELPLGKARAASANGVWHHVRVECRGNRYRVIVNGDVVLERTDWRNARASGRIALAAYTGGSGECTVYYDNVLVTPIE